MKLIDQLHSGLDAGVTRHWRYTKEVFDIKPEYLMTVAVADALTEGYDGIDGIDVQIRLECPTRNIAYQLVTDAVGLKRWFDIKKDVKIRRSGRVDIVSTANKRCHLVELKGFDPSKAQIEKELVRIQQCFALNDGVNSMQGGHVVFPSLTHCEKRLKKYGNTLLTDKTLKFEVVCREQKTQEDPQDGIPCYYTNSISITRVGA